MSNTVELYRSDEEQLKLFEDTTLPFAEWTHRAHLRIGHIYLSKHSLLDATDLIRDGIKKYNLAQDLTTTVARGCHETITVVFAALIEAAMKSCSERCDWQEFLALNPELLDKGILEEFYSKELLFSSLARNSFVAPDKRPLP